MPDEGAGKLRDQLIADIDERLAEYGPRERQ
jgi:hypothetical protein